MSMKFTLITQTLCLVTPLGCHRISSSCCVIGTNTYRNLILFGARNRSRFILEMHNYLTVFDEMSKLAWENSRHLATLPLVSPPNDVWETSAEIPYWWRVTTQIWVVLLIGRAAWEIWFNQSGALPRSGFLSRHLARKPRLCPIRPRIAVTKEKETKITTTRRKKEDINEKINGGTPA